MQPWPKNSAHPMAVTSIMVYRKPRYTSLSIEYFFGGMKQRSITFSTDYTTSSRWSIEDINWSSGCKICTMHSTL